MTRTVIDSTQSILLSSVHSGCDVLMTGGQLNATLPAPIANCDITIINGDSGSGKVLSGFPGDVNPTLYPNQAVAVNSDGNVWFATSKPGRWKIPGGTTVYVNPNSSVGNDANDGLSPSTPLRTIGRAANVCQVDFDTNQTTPIIAPITGTTFTNDPLILGGQPTGGNLIQFSPYGNGSVTMVCSGPAITVGDNAELDIRVNGLSSGASLILQGNTLDAAASASLYQHNNGLIDMEGDITIVGNGPNGSAIFFDGPCPGASIANGFKVQGVFGDIFRMDEGGGRYTVGGVIQPVNDIHGTPPTATRLFSILGTNELLMGGQPAMGGYASLGPSLVSGNALLVTFGNSIPGGVTTNQGGRVTVVKTS